MGQSVALSFGLVFLSTLLIGSMLFVSIRDSYDIVQMAQDAEEDRIQTRNALEIDLQSATLSNQGDQIHLYAVNLGTVAIYNFEYFDIFSNVTLQVNAGPYVNDTWIPNIGLHPQVSNVGCYWDYEFIDDNHYNPAIWDPTETLNITIFLPSSVSEDIYTYRINIAEGISDYFAINTTAL